LWARATRDAAPPAGLARQCGAGVRSEAGSANAKSADANEKAMRRRLPSPAMMRYWPIARVFAQTMDKSCGRAAIAGPPSGTCASKPAAPETWFEALLIQRRKGPPTDRQWSTRPTIIPPSKSTMP